jgi:hypothetical protein
MTLGDELCETVVACGRRLTFENSSASFNRLKAPRSITTDLLNEVKGKGKAFPLQA